MPTGLEKMTVEVPFIKGQQQKPGQQVMEADTPYYLRNVDLREGSVFPKRCGHSAVTHEYDGTVSFVSSGVKRVVSLDDELVAITTAAGSIGSGGGAASSGDTVFALAESAQKWKAFGKIQRPTMDVLYPITTHGISMVGIDCAVLGDVMITVEDPQVGHSGLYVTLTDLVSNTERKRQVIGSSQADRLIKCVATASYLCVVWHNDTVGTFHVTKYDPVTLTDTQYDLLVGTSGAADHADAAVSSDLIYILYPDGATGTTISVVPIATVTGTVGSPVVVDTFVSGTHRPTAITISGAELLAVWWDPNTGNVRARAGTLTPAFTGAALTVATPGDLYQACRAVIVSSTVRLVFWETAYSSTTETAYAGGNLSGSGTAASVYWARLEGAVSTNPMTLGWGGAARRSLNLVLWGQPFVLDARVFLPVMAIRHVVAGDTALGLRAGAYITEVEPTISSAQATLMPQAACLLDSAGLKMGRNTSVVSSKAYIAATRRGFEPDDVDAAYYHLESLQAQVNVFDFSDDHRWQPAIHSHMVAFSGALPYVYDGATVHECGFAWRPRIMGYELDTGGSLSTTETYSFRVTYEFRDTTGRKWMSQVSYATDAEGIDDPTAGQQTLVFAVPPLTLTMMPDPGFYFAGTMVAVLWRATAAQQNAGTFVRDSEVEFHPYDTANIILTASGSDDDKADNERLYIIGGEIENYTAPPCRSICEHRDRLFAYNTEWRTLDYTKPLDPSRGIEWSQSQRVACQETIVAIVSLEHTLVCFSSKRIYALEGAGPSSTGVPPDAFARLVLVNADIGCSEINAAWRCPAGIVFKSQGGFWLLDRGMGVSFIGAPVQADLDYLDAQVGGPAARAPNSAGAICGVVDEKANCMRIYHEGTLVDLVDDDFGSNLTRFNYWFDSGRWSVDTLQCTDPAWACYHRGLNYIVWGNQVQSGIAVEDPDVFSDIGTFYGQGIESGWLRFGDLSSFKRVWRLLVSLETPENGVSPLWVKISKDFESTPVLEDLFLSSELTEGAHFLRVHLEKQKVRSLKILLAEAEGQDEDSPGFKFHGIGFELGMKRGAFKAATISR